MCWSGFEYQRFQLATCQPAGSPAYEQTDPKPRTSQTSLNLRRRICVHVLGQWPTTSAYPVATPGSLNLRSQSLGPRGIFRKPRCSGILPFQSGVPNKNTSPRRRFRLHLFPRGAGCWGGKGGKSPASRVGPGEGSSQRANKQIKQKASEPPPRYETSCNNLPARE